MRNGCACQHHRQLLQVGSVQDRLSTFQIPGGGSTDAAQISAWVQAHFTAQSVGGMTVYNLTVPAASS
jgi:hypothetical protein